MAQKCSGYSLCIALEVYLSQHGLLVLKCWARGDDAGDRGRKVGGKGLNFLEVEYSPRNVSMYKRLRNIWIEFSQRIRMASKF